jgi:hypothetical protein
MKKKRIKKAEIDIEFEGYSPHNCQEQFFTYPMILENYWWAMSGSEQKVLTFILRKTFGWQKQADSISLSQFTHGDGTGKGIGLSRAQVKRAITSLEKKKFIKVTRRTRKPSHFELPLSKEIERDIQSGANCYEVDNTGTPEETRANQKKQTAYYMEEVVKKNPQQPKYGNIVNPFFIQ